jgi:hypothetical protein
MVGDIVQGDERYTWKKDNLEEVNFVKNIFQKYLKKGWIAIGVVSGNKKQIFSFDPLLEEIILTPLLVGG